MREHVLCGLRCAAPAAMLTLSIVASAAAFQSGPATAPGGGTRGLGKAAGPLGGGGAVDLEPVPERASPRPARRIVYTCVTPQLVTFSDRPCGPLPEIRQLTLSSPGPGAGAAASTRPGDPKASTLRAGRDDRASSRKDSPETEPERSPDEIRRDTCRRLAETVATIDQSMRSGYSAREAARLWTRWREAKERLREAEC